MANLHCSRPPGYTLKLDAMILWRAMSSEKCMVTEEMLKFSMVFEDAAGSKTDYWPLGRGRLIRCCHGRDYRRHDLESSEPNHAIWKMHDKEDWIQLLSWERLPCFDRSSTSPHFCSLWQPPQRLLSWTRVYFYVQFIKTQIVVKWLINSMLLNFYNSFNGLNSMRPETETIDEKYSLFESILDFSKTSRCFLNNMNSFSTYPTTIIIGDLWNSTFESLWLSPGTVQSAR